MTAPKFETLMIGVFGPVEGHADGKLWRWTVDRQRTGSVNVAKGSADTEVEAWDEARIAAVSWLHDRADS